MAFCREPSDEHIGYLRELIDAGVDLDLVDEQGYTALDHAVFNGDALSGRLVMEGLRRGPNGKTERQLDVMVMEARGACGEKEGQYLHSPDDEDKTQYRRMIHATKELLQLHPEVDRERLGIWVDYSSVDQDSPSAGVNALPMIVAECDAVISLVDNEYYERAWCSVEIAFIQQLRKSYHRHLWYEHVRVSTDVVSGRGKDQYVLREAPTGFEVSMARNKLS
ncbi:hypothetical protein PG999_001671 [Apiospora kogelbergensis]|uniref:TIR domain-containing protein n=1 Tax=Apiospora kogelbergensis TaxID=1337665 RepID=A0AAW0R666_9PEZI